MARVPTLPRQRVCVVTGASSGIGAETARGLAQAGATVVLVGRNPQRTQAVAERVRTHCGHDQVHVELCDFGSLAQVDDLADRLLDRWPRLHLLVNNAGLWHPDRRVSQDGFEDTLAVNHLAPFHLTNRLLPRLRASAPARVVTVSSRLHGDCPGIDFEDPFVQHRRYAGLTVYAHSKLANVLFANELARRLEGTGVTSTSVHPGDVATDVVRDNPLLRAAMTVARPLLLTPWEGAQTTLHAAASTEAEGRSGVYFSECRETPCSEVARDVDQAQRLWTCSEAWVQDALGSG